MSQIRLSAACFKAAVVNGFDDFAGHISHLVEQATLKDRRWDILDELYQVESTSPDGSKTHVK